MVAVIALGLIFGLSVGTLVGVYHESGKNSTGSSKIGASGRSGRSWNKPIEDKIQKGLEDMKYLMRNPIPALGFPESISPMILFNQTTFGFE